MFMDSGTIFAIWLTSPHECKALVYFDDLFVAVATSCLAEDQFFPQGMSKHIKTFWRIEAEWLSILRPLCHTGHTPCISLCRLYMYRSFVLWFSTFKSFHSFSRDVSCLATLFLNEIKKNNAFLYSPHLHLRVVLFGLLLDMHDELYDEDRIGTTPFTTRHDRSWYHEMP